MAKIKFSSTVQKSEFTIINQVFFEKIQKIKTYLSYKIGQDKNHNVLLQDLDALILEATNYQIKVTIFGRQESLLEKVKLANQACERLNSCSHANVITFPCNVDRLLKDCDLVFLVVNSSKKIIPPEQKLVIKAQKRNITLVIIDFNQEQNQIQSWLENFSLSTVNYFNFPDESCEQSHLLLVQEKYANFLSKLLIESIVSRESIFEEMLRKIINKYFMQRKTKCWEEIKHHKQNYLSGENHPQFQEKVRQLNPKINKILQYNFKIIRQTLQESKQELINPFVSTSFIHYVQQVISESLVVQIRENKKIYLNLVVKESGIRRQAIHRHILELYQQKIDLWLEQQWQVLEQELDIVNQLRAKSDRELKMLESLGGEELNLPRVPQPVFDLSKYICPTTMSEINCTIFDYHYSQSPWFRIAIAIAAGTLFFLLTNRLFGFIFLVLQIVNLITGQSPKSLKLKQQTKELKKVADNRYQNLVKFIADKLIQDINIFLDHQCQLYQDQVNSYIQESNRKLGKIKQKIILNQNKISELNQDQQNIMQIINDHLP